MASAADLPLKAVKAPPIVGFNWTGFYIGGFAGGAFADGNATATDPMAVVGGGFYNGGNLVTSYGLKSSFIGGGTIGYNWQTPGSNFVFGLEGEAGYVHAQGSKQDVNAFNVGFALPDSVNTTRVGDAYGVIAGRIGYTADRVMVYAKGGVAFVGNSTNFSDLCNTGACGGRLLYLGRSDTQVTYALGAGVEYAFTNNWSLKGEYLYLATQKTYTQTGADLPAGTFSYTNTVTDPGLHTVKVGLNYRFGGPIVAKY